MPYQGLSDGLYVARRRSDKIGWHFGVVDVGNRFRMSRHFHLQPMVAHQTPPQIRLDRLEDVGGPWYVLMKIDDEQGARVRLRQMFKTPMYDLFGNNCEQVAGYIATGVYESRQLQTAAFVALITALAILIVRSNRPS